MASRKLLFYLGSGEIGKKGRDLYFKLADPLFDEEEGAVLSKDANNDLFYAHDPKLGYLVVRSKFAEDGRFWYEHDNLNSRFVKLDKPTKNIRRITIVKPVLDNPLGFVDSDWELTAGKTVHYVSTEKMAQGSPKSFYILNTGQLEELMKQRELAWNRDTDRERLRKKGFTHLIDIEDGGKDDQDTQSRIESRRIEVRIEDISGDVESLIDLGYLFVRLGANEVPSQDPTVDNDSLFRVRNEERSVESKYIPEEQVLEAKTSLKVHNIYPTQFKMYADVEGSEHLRKVKNEFDLSPSCRSASVSGSLKNRIYFLLEEFGTTETPEGFVNNIVYPK